MRNANKSSANSMSTPGKVATIFNKQPLQITKGSLMRLPKDDLKAVVSYCKVRMASSATKEDFANKVFALIASHKNLAKYKTRITLPPSSTTSTSVSCETGRVMLPHSVRTSTAPTRPSTNSTVRCIFAPMDSVNWTSLSAGEQLYAHSFFKYKIRR